MTRKEEILSRARERQSKFNQTCESIKAKMSGTSEDQKWADRIANNFQSAFINHLRNTFIR